VKVLQRDRAYIAGLFDGEGHVRVNEAVQLTTVGYRVRVTLTNTDLKVLRWVQKCYGGKIGELARDPSLHRKPCYVLWFRHAEMTPFLKAVFPDLRIRKEPAKLALQFLALKKQNDKPSPAQHRAQARLYKSYRKYRRAGYQE
jgi:hypothetical protein